MTTVIEVAVANRLETEARDVGRGSAVHHVTRVRVDHPAQLGGFRRRLRALLREQGLRAAEREPIVLAAVEALSNALRVCDVKDRSVEVTVSLVADYVCVEVRDAAEGFKGVCVELIENAGETEEHGRGLYLMRQLMESLELVPRARGTLVRMVKKIEAGERR